MGRSPLIIDWMDFKETHNGTTLGSQIRWSTWDNMPCLPCVIIVHCKRFPYAVMYRAPRRSKNYHIITTSHKYAYNQQPECLREMGVVCTIVRQQRLCEDFCPWILALPRATTTVIGLHWNDGSTAFVQCGSQAIIISVLSNVPDPR